MKSIQIFDTEFDDKYLVIYDNAKIFYCNQTGKFILNRYNSETSIEEITKLTNVEYQTEYEVNDIESFINNSIQEKTNKRNIYKKIVELFDSNIIPSSKIFFIKNYSLFIMLLVCMLLLNVYYSYNYSSNYLNIKEIICVIVGFLFIATLHELGHASFAKAYGINSGKIGIGWYFLFPVFYINLNEIWRLERKKRIVVNLGGIFTQLVIGCLLILLSFFYSSPIIIKLLQLNCLTLLLNLNPFIKFDGYWVLSDFLNDKELQVKSNEIVKQLIHFKKPEYSFFLIVFSIARLLFFLLVYYIIIIYLFNILVYLWKIF